MVDRRKLHIMDPHVVAKATEHIPEMVALIERLIATGNAYVAPDGAYFGHQDVPGLRNAPQPGAAGST